MNVPTFAAEKVVTKEFFFTAAWLQLITQLLTELNNNFGNGVGLVPPSMTATQVGVLAGAIKAPQNGTLLYNSTANTLMAWDGATSTFKTLTWS